MTRLAVFFLAAAAALVLSGCGIRGDLERPPPLWGPDERTPAEMDTQSAGDGGRDEIDEDREARGEDEPA